jgi:hypothetical protein
MAAKRVLGAFAVFGLGSLVACASLVGLDDSDLPIGSGGAASGSSSGSGQITQDGITITPKDLGFPAVKCGASSTATITLVNASAEDQPYEATMPTTDVFTFKSGASGTVKAHDTATITLEEKTAKPGTANAVVAIKTKSSVASVNVAGQVQGATLAITPATADFGFVKENTISAPINAIFANEGTTSITINDFDGPPEKSSFSLPKTVVVPAGGTISAPITMNGGPKGDAPVVAAVTPIVDTSLLCGAPVPVLTLSGQRVSDDVVVNPASADFGSVDCNGTTSTTAVITVSNFSIDSTATFTTTQPANTRFKVTPSTGTVPNAAGATPGKQDLTITVPNAGSQFGAISENLDVNITAPTAKTYHVKLTMSVVGAVLEVNPTSLSNIQNGSSKSFDVSNVGNALVCVTFESDKPEFDPDEFGQIFPGFPISEKVGFSSSSDKSGTITIKHASCFPPIKSAAFCTAPPSVPVTGHN